METLPVEMVKQISDYLTPQDLARCCAVSQRWCETFNMDLLWKRHCDSSLEEPLRKTSSTVQPAFVISKEEGLTFPPIGRWRLAFMRENHLWRNWMTNNVSKNKIPIPEPKRYIIEETISNLLSKCNRFFSSGDSPEQMRKVCECLFLTDTLLVGWHSNSIRVWDVNSNPAVCVVKTDTSVNVLKWDSISLVEGNMLIIKQLSSVQAFIVDLPNKCIKLKFKIFLDFEHAPFIVNQHNSSGQSKPVGLAVSGSCRELNVYDLTNGMKIKKENCPEANKTAKITGMKTSRHSDDIIVLFHSSENAMAYVYSTEHLGYLAGPFTLKGKIELDQCAINKHYVALSSYAVGGLLIINYLTSEFVFKIEDERVHYIMVFPLLSYKNDFIFMKNIGWDYHVKSFSLETKTITTICEQSRLPHYNDCQLAVINDRFLVVCEVINDFVKPAKSVFIPSGNSLKLINMVCPRLDERFNQSFTRSYRYDSDGNLVILHYW